MIAGVLVGEGVYGLRVVRETTSTAYRAGSILGGLLVLGSQWNAD